MSSTDSPASSASEGENVELKRGSCSEGILGYVCAALAFVAVVVFITFQDIKTNGFNDGTEVSIVVSVGIVIVTTLLFVALHPSVYARAFCLDRSAVPAQPPYWYWRTLTAFALFLPLYAVLFFTGDHFLGKTGKNSRVDGHMIAAIIGANTALALIFGFVFGHAGGKEARQYPDGKTNYVGIFAKVLLVPIWIFLFGAQGVTFYVFSTYEDGAVRSLGQFVYWAVVILVWVYLLTATYFKVDAKIVDGVRVPDKNQSSRLQQVRNVVQTLLFGMLTWENMLYTMISAREHPHLSEMFVYCAAGAQCMAYSFVVMSIITSIAKQAAAASVNAPTDGQGDGIYGPYERLPARCPMTD